MKPGTAVLLTLLMQAPPPVPVTPVAATGVIEGVVVRADTGAPVAGAEVTRTSTLDPPNGFNAPNPNPPVLTGSDGKFVFKDLRPATYRLFVTASGLVRQEYGQRTAYGPGKPVNLTEGETVSDLSIKLTEAGLITGRILTDTGQPASDILVQLVRTAYSYQGRYFTGGGMTNADDRGEFRLFGVTPGSYYLVAGNARVTQPPAPGAGDEMMIRTSRTDYGLTFYPGASEFNGATLLEVKPAAEVRANLTTSGPQKGYRISGRIAAMDDGQPGTILINLIAPNPQSAVLSTLQPRNTATTPGTFEFQNVPPGKWGLRAEVRIPNQPQAGPPDPAASAARALAQAQTPSAQMQVHVTNADVVGLVLTMRAGAVIPARIVVDDGPPNVPNLDRISVNIVADQISVNTAASRPGTDGTFQIGGLRDGDYTVRVNSVPAGYYVKSIRYAGDDILRKPFHFNGAAETGTLEVMLRQGAVQITGTVVDARLHPVAGVQAVLIPEAEFRNRFEYFKTATTDAAGHFTMREVAPGQYRVLSWEALDSNGYFDPEVLQRSEPQALNLTIEESVNPNIEVKIVPAP